MKTTDVYCDKCKEPQTNIPNTPFMGTHSKEFSTLKLDISVGNLKFENHLCYSCLKNLDLWFKEEV